MRFLVDECTGPTVAAWLRDQNHDVFSVFDEDRGMDDNDIIQKALEGGYRKASPVCPKVRKEKTSQQINEADGAIR